MKPFFFILLLVSTLVACNNAPIEGNAKGNEDSANAAQNVALPYNVPVKPDWQKGPDANVAIAMNTLKAYQDNNIDGMQQYLADSVAFRVDDYSFEGTRDSLLQIMKEHRNQFNTVAINMHDYESVRSKSRGEEWVSLWYTETNTHKDGKVDSIFIMDDIQIKNGKVSEIDSKMRRLPKQQ